MAEALRPDICVIGGGPAGIRLAVAAANAAVPVVLIEKGTMGGANLSEGAVPAMALLAAASEFETLRRGPAFGVTGTALMVDFGKVREHIASVRAAVAATVSAERLTALGVKVVAGAARFADRRTVVAGETTIKARRYVLATGAAADPLRIAGLEMVPSLTAGTAFDLAEKPARLRHPDRTDHGSGRGRARWLASSRRERPLAPDRGPRPRRRRHPVRPHRHHGRPAPQDHQPAGLRDRRCDFRSGRGEPRRI